MSCQAGAKQRHPAPQDRRAFGNNVAATAMWVDGSDGAGQMEREARQKAFAMSDMIVIAVDDLTYWAGPNTIFSSQIIAPNIQRLATEGVSFSNAYTPEAICNPARASFWSGLSPNKTGIHANDQVWYENIDPTTTLTARFLQAGYDVGGFGKLTHSIDLPPSVWQGMYSEFGGKVGFDATNTYGPLPPGVTESQMSDHITIDRAISFLDNHDPSDPFMLNIGLVKPHLGWVVPQEYFDLYPLEQIVVPGLVGDDMSNVPAFIRDQLVNSRGHTVPDSVARAKEFLQGYFASLSYADAQIGRLFDELDATGRWDTTTIMLWSDHGYHLGDRDNLWGKFTLWEEATKVPFVFKLPDSAHGGRIVDDVVNLVDAYPTLLDLAGLNIPPGLSGDSLKSLLLQTGPAAGDGMSITMMFGSIMLRTATHSFIRYEDGSTELYDMINDRDQVFNLAGQPGQAALMTQLEAILVDKADIVLDTNGIANGTSGSDLFYLNDVGDIANGGRGNDSYYVNSLNVTVRESFGQGIDTVFTRVDFTLPDNVENVVISRYSGGAAIQITGNMLNNIMTGSSGSEAMYGGAGNDKLRGGSGFDSLYGGTGNDSIVGAARGDLMYGGDGNDVYYGGGGADTIYGGSGADYMIVRGADLRLFGGSENDTFIMTGGSAIIEGGTGADQFIGSGGATIIASYQSATAGFRADLGQAGNNTGEASGDRYSGVTGLIGGSGNDSLIGNAGANVLQGGAGQDTLVGLGGDDLLRGGAGADRLDGGTGTNTADYTDSAAVQADLWFVAGNTGDAAGDTYIAIQALIGGAGNDTLLGHTDNNSLTGGDGNDLIYGRAGADTLRGGLGNDRLIGGVGADLLDGGLGIDTVQYSGTVGQRIDLLLPSTNTGEAVGDSFISIEVLLGGSGNDTLLGSGQAEQIAGWEGDDQLFGRSGNDTLRGGLGNDTLIGGLGADVLDGGAGADTVQYLGNVAQRIDLLLSHNSTGEAAGDTFLGIEVVVGGSANDTLLGNLTAELLDGSAGDDVIYGRAGDDTLRGGTGNDMFFGGAGADVIFGGAGIDTLHYGVGGAINVDLMLPVGNTGEAVGDRVFEIEVIIGSAQGDRIFASASAERLEGSGGRDTLDGRAGNDTLVGGQGNDHLTGGAGVDRFVFAHGSDVISDMTLAQGDNIAILRSALGGQTLTGAQIVATYATLTGTAAFFDFGGGNTLTLEGVTSLDGLSGHIFSL